MLTYWSYWFNSLYATIKYTYYWERFYSQLLCSRIIVYAALKLTYSLYATIKYTYYWERFYSQLLRSRIIVNAASKLTYSLLFKTNNDCIRRTYYRWIRMNERRVVTRSCGSGSYDTGWLWSSKPGNGILLLIRSFQKWKRAVEREQRKSEFLRTAISDDVIWNKREFWEKGFLTEMKTKLY